MKINEYITVAKKGDMQIIRVELKDFFKAKKFDPDPVRNLIIQVYPSGVLNIGYTDWTDSKHKAENWYAQNHRPFVRSRQVRNVDKADGIVTSVKDVILSGRSINSSLSGFDSVIDSILKDLKFRKIVDAKVSGAQEDAEGCFDINGSTGLLMKSSERYQLDDKFRERACEALGGAVIEKLRELVDFTLIDMLEDHVGCAALDHYNECIRVPRLRQLFEVSPILATIWVKRGAPIEVFDLKLQDQIQNLTREANANNRFLYDGAARQRDERGFNENGMKSALHFVKTVKRNGHFMRLYDGDNLIAILKKISHLDVNHLRKLDTASKWKCLMILLEFNVGLAQRALLDPNFDEEMIRRARGSSKYLDLQTAIQPLADYAREMGNNLPMCGLRRLYEDQHLWHQRLQVQREANQEARRQEIALRDADRRNNIATQGSNFPEPAIGILAENDKYVLKYLGSELDLFDEGTEQGHCVYSYTSDARKGQCFIYGLRDKNDKRVATIELNSRYEVRQSRGKHNRMLTPEETRAVNSLLNELKKQKKPQPIAQKRAKIKAPAAVAAENVFIDDEW